jgi:uncharacterized damage-inducible protein DinB
VTLNQFIEAALEQESQLLGTVVKDITPQELAWRPGPEANHIAWILWHMFRVEDFWIQFFAQRQLELWERDGWHRKFGLPTRDTGFEHTAEQVRSFPALDLGELLQYRESVRSGTLTYLRGLSPQDPQDFDVIPRERRPDMSVGGIFRQILGELFQHQGHMAYLRGLYRSLGNPG